MNEQSIFADGVYFEKREGSPSYVVGKISIKVSEAIPFIEKYKNKGGYVNIDVLMSQKTNKPYCKLNTYGMDSEKKPNPEVFEEAQKSVQVGGSSEEIDTIEYPEDDQTTTYIDENGVEQSIPF